MRMTRSIARRRVAGAIASACGALVAISVAPAAPGHAIDAQPAAASAREIAREIQNADSLLAFALARAAEGDTALALDLLERANKLAPKNADVLFWRAVVLNRTTFLRVTDIPRNILAWRLLERAEQLDRHNARYALEMGRIRLATPLLRLEAERQFRRGLEVARRSKDPAMIAETAYELALIKQRRYNTTRDRYQITSPGVTFDPVAANSRLHYVREFLEQQSRPLENIGSVDRSQAEELFRTALDALPTHEPSAIGLMSVLYDQTRYAEMIRVALPFVDSATGTARVRLAAGLASYRLGLLKDADRYFREAIERLSDRDRRDMLALSRIVTRTDAAAYDRLSDTARLHTDSAYWEGADPLLSTPENEAWLEFMARNAFSDLRWTDGDMHQVGWKTDRGIIVTRYGEPPQVATFAPEGNLDIPDAIGRILTVWRWPDSDIHFVFTGPPAMNTAMFAANFRAFAEETRDEVPFSLRNVPLVMNMDTLPMQVARFRGRTPGDVTLVVAATANPAKLYRGADVSAGTLAWTLRMGAPSRLQLVNTDTLRLDLPAPVATQVWVRDVKPGNYRLRVEAIDPSIFSAAGRAQDEVDARPIVPGFLQASDVLIGHRTAVPAGPIRRLEDVAFLPRGHLTMSQNEQFTLYWEQYGLVPDANGRVRFDVSIVVRLLEIDRVNVGHVPALLGRIADAVGLSPLGDQALGVSYPREEPLDGRDRVPQMFTLGLGSSPAGTYRIEVTVTDKVTSQKSRTDRVFFLGKK